MSQTDFVDTSAAAAPLPEKWDDLPIKHELLRGIYSYGFERPSAIQSRAIGPILSGVDVIAQAQSGTGKTGAFTISMLNMVDTKIPHTQVLIMAPTHELVFQISTVITSIGSMIPDLHIKTLVGGKSLDSDIQCIRETVPHIIVGSPGRVHDILRRNILPTTNYIKHFVLDEADEMLSHGLKTQIYNIFQYMNTEVQVVLFSATFPREIEILTEKFMRSPVKIMMAAEKLSLDCIEQYYVALASDDEKYERLRDFYSAISILQCIIYCNSVERVITLYNSMLRDGFPVCCIHSNMDKSERERAFASFRSGTFRVLISSNITARGIDIQQVSTVINFDIPKCVHTYLHRIGRGGRWGKKGVAINFITRQDVRKMRDIENHYKIQIKEIGGDIGAILRN